MGGKPAKIRERERANHSVACQAEAVQGVDEDCGFDPSSIWNLLSREAALTVSLEQVTLSIMALLRGIFWFALFIVLAFCFVVLFEYGPHDFKNGFQKEFARVKSFVVKQTEKMQKPKKQP